MTSESELQEVQDQKIVKEKAAKNLLTIGIISIIMMFGGLVSAFIVGQGGNFWVNLNLPNAFWISSGIIIASSLTINLALSFIKRNDAKKSNLMLLLTLVLGIAFGFYQFKGWGQLIERGSFFIGPIMDKTDGGFFLKGEYGKDFTVSFGSEELVYENLRLYFPDGRELSAIQYDNLMNQRNTASSYYYLFTFLHLLHLVGGILYLIGVTVRGYLNQFSADNYLKIKLISIYWHFIDALWLFLFLFLQFIH